MGILPSGSTRSRDSLRATPVAVLMAWPATLESEPSTSTSTVAVVPSCRRRA